MKTRSDVSAVQPQGGYIAKRCPVVIQNDILVPDRRNEVPADVQMHAQAGVEYETRVATALAVAHADESVFLDGVGWDEAGELTLEAMVNQVGVIYGANLPTDEAGRRSGRPDLLVWHLDGYVPVDVKHRIKLDARDGATALVTDLDRLSLADAYMLDGFQLRRKDDDALQLAHYRRMLEALGHAASSTFAGIIGREGLVVWYDLDEPMWQTKSTSDPDKKSKLRTSLERYDFEFAFRLDIAVVAMAWRDTRKGDLLVEPRSSSECGGCVYNSYCSEILQAGSGDASLIPGTTFEHWNQLRTHGLRERADVARLHYPTAELVSRDVDVEYFLREKSGHPPDAPVSALRPRATAQIQKLEAAGFKTVADLERLDPLTAKFGRSAASQILNARAAVGPEPVYQRPGRLSGGVPRADIEIDLDMESILEGVYLWGALLTYNTRADRSESAYYPFVTWDQMSGPRELATFMEMWTWLADLRSTAEEEGLTLRVYVWHEGAEAGVARRIAGGHSEEMVTEVNALIKSEQWVDLKRVFERGWITGGPTGLKAIAPLAGFEWDVDDPGGGMSMVRYLEAVQDASTDARKWILDYNRGDVEATSAIRQWLDAKGSDFPEVSTD